MPYTKAHKNKTRVRILENSFRLFALKGFEGATVNDLMNSCELTRGGFYAHFASKAELYSETLKYAASSTKLASLKPDSLSSKQWLCLLLDEYLSLEHVHGKSPCPLAFLVTDVNMKNEEANMAYANSYSAMNKALMHYANDYSDCDEEDILSVTSMIIGAIAIARTLQHQDSIKTLLSACRREAGIKLGGI